MVMKSLGQDQPLIFNMTSGVTPISHQIYTLHMLIFYVCVIIGIIVFGVLIYSLIEHRKSKGQKCLRIFIPV